MRSPRGHSRQELKRTIVMGAVFIVVGLGFSIHGGLNLLEIYSRPVSMFEMTPGLSPEKGQMWSEFFAGMSVCLIGILLDIKAGMDLKGNRRTK